jgi:hypothetical protein
MPFYEGNDTLGSDLPAGALQCRNCARCTWNVGPDCGVAGHSHCEKCGHCIGRHVRMAYAVE